LWINWGELHAINAKARESLALGFVRLWINYESIFSIEFFH
jgi:hypothetical protein